MSCTLIPEPKKRTGGRAKGYYWCKPSLSCSWTPHYWNGTKFTFPNDYEESDMAEIHNKLIPLPR